MELMDLNWVRLVLDSLGLWPTLGLIALIFLGIPIVAGLFVAMVSSGMDRSGWAGFAVGAVAALIVIGIAYAVF
ncbi:MAG: hypothetical protein F4Y11_05600 [Chloroflexi bacterium]|nr:hypothetical protein [Chloroflexota bacterium]